MNNKTWVSIIAIIIILAGVWYYQAQVSVPASGEVIKVGALLSLTGDASAWGENAQKAIQLAVEEKNASGGIDGKVVEMIYEDTGGEPKKAVSAYQKLVSVDKVEAILGPLNQTEVISVIQNFSKDNMPVIVPGYVPLTNRQNLKNPLTVWMDARMEAELMANYVFNQGVKTVAVIGSLDSWESDVSDAFYKEFLRIGGKVVAKEIVQPDSTDMKLPITRAISSNPQAVFLGTYYQFVNSSKVLNDLQYKGKLYGIEVDDYLASQTKGWSTGLQFIAPDFYTNKFVKDFETKFKVKPGLPAGQSFDAANVLFSLLSGKNNRGEVIQAINEFKKYDGVSGQLEILADGRSTLPTAIFQIDENGLINKIK